LIYAEKPRFTPKDPEYKGLRGIGGEKREMGLFDLNAEKKGVSAR
jgi:hypothetical protein